MCEREARIGLNRFLVETDCDVQHLRRITQALIEGVGAFQIKLVGDGI